METKMADVAQHTSDVQYWIREVARRREELRSAEAVLEHYEEMQEDALELLRGLAAKVKAQEEKANV
jgi:hypothetical protein